MEILEKTQMGWLLISLSGRVDRLEDSRKMYYHILGKIKSGALQVALDCSELEFVGSTFLSKFLLFNSVLKEKEGRFALIVSPSLQGMLETVGHTKVLETFLGLEEFEKKHG